MSLSNDELAALILPWARDNRPEPYQQTIAVSGSPQAYRAYLLRLVELRWHDEPTWRPQAPIRALEETAIVQRVRHRPSGLTIEVQGRLEPGTRRPRTEPRLYGWANLAEALEAGIDFATYHGLIEHWALEIDE